MSHFRHLSIAMEAIEFQNGAFFKELSLIFEPYAGKGHPDAKDIKTIVNTLVVVAKKHTNITFDFQIIKQGTCIYVPTVNAGNVMVSDWARFVGSDDGMRMINKGEGLSTGQVNLEKSTVSGDYAKYKPKLIIDIDHFGYHGMDGGEIAAVVLHEVGHWFSYLEMLDRTMTTNFVLIGLDKVLRGGDVKEREVAIKKAGKAFSMEREAIEDLQKSSSDKSVITVMVASAFNEATSQSHDGFYDMNSFEMVADQFAARHGAGRSLVTALDKIYAAYGANVKAGKLSYYFLNVYEVAAAVIRLGFAGYLILAGTITHILLGTLLLLITYACLRMSHLDGGVPTYDKPLDRANRVRRQLVEYCKDSRLNREIVESLTRDIAIIDVTAKDYSAEITWMQKIDEFIFKSSRNRSAQVKFQQELEALAINDLFLKSQQLKYA